MSIRTSYKAALLLPISFSLSSIAFADTKQEPAYVLNPLVIETSRGNTTKADSPQVVTIITHKQIEQQLAITSDSSQALSNLLPAYSLNTQKLNNSSQTFRGRSVLYMIDGVPQSNPIREGSRSAHTIDLSMVQRIEVIHGATAVHGLGATGGIINFITKSNDSNTLKQHIDVQTTMPTKNINSDTMAYKIDYQAEGAKGNFDYLVGLTNEIRGMYLDADGNYVGSATVRGDIMDSKSYDGFIKLGYWLSDEQRLEFEFNKYKLKGRMGFTGVPGDRDKGIATGSVKGRPRGLAPFNDVQTTSLNYTNSDLDGMNFKAQLFHQDFKGRYGATNANSFQDTNIAPQGTLYDQSQNQSEKIGAKFSLTKSDLMQNKLSITTGLDLLQDKTSQILILTHRTYVPKTKYVNYAPFVQFEFKPIERLILQAGARNEHAKLDVNTFHTVAHFNNVKVNGGSPSFSKTVYNAGAVFKITPTVSIFANYSQGFGMPDVGRVLRAIKVPGKNVDSLIDLAPIITDNYEAGFRINRHSYDFEASYYESNSKLGSKIVPDSSGLYTIERQKTKIHGAEASLGFQLNKSNRFQASYSYIQGKSDTNGDGKVDTKLGGANIPPNRLVASWNAQWNEKLSSMLQVNRAFSRSFDSTKFNFSGYTLVDASMGYKLPVGHMSVAVANLFNKDYFTYYSQAAYANDDFYFKGRGRTVTVSYGVNF